MTRAPRLSARMRALNEAAEIAEWRAVYFCELAERWKREAPDCDISIGVLRAAATEAEVIARLIRERMQNRRAR